MSRLVKWLNLARTSTLSLSVRIKSTSGAPTSRDLMTTAAAAKHREIRNDPVWSEGNFAVVSSDDLRFKLNGHLLFAARQVPLCVNH